MKKKKLSIRARLGAMAAAALLAIGGAVVVDNTVVEPPPASAYAMTYVQNVGSVGFTVVRDNGTRLNLYPGQGAWGIKGVYVGYWECLTGTVTFCGSGGTATSLKYFGVGQFYERLVQR